MGQHKAVDSTKMAQELIYKRQLLCYFLNIQEDLAGVRERLYKYRELYYEELLQLQAKISGSSKSLPKEEVYPRFDSLGKVAQAIELDLKLASCKEKCFDLLMSHKDGFNPTLGKVAQDTEAEDTTQVVPPAGEEEGGPTLIPMDASKDFMSIPLDFQGFCIHSLVDQGILIPGNPSIGVVQFKGRYCVFTKPKKLMEFLADPGRYFIGVREACYRNPELIQPLRLHEDFPKSSLYAILKQHTYLVGGEAKGASLVDTTTQTPVHFVESHIDPNYQWNEWVLRRNALRMADMRQKSTKSAQTACSSFQREKEQQTYLKKDESTNTVRQQGTNSVRWKRYITGLRGDTTNMKIVNFQFEL